MDNNFLHDQIVNISKAGAFDVISKHNGELKEENERLKKRVKFLEDLINEYTGKMLANLEGKDDIPPELFTNR